MAQQPGRELATTDTTTRTQDARFQESRFSPEISLNSRSRLQQLQTFNVISFQQERTVPFGRRRCRHGRKPSLRREANMSAELLRPQFRNVTKPSRTLVHTYCRSAESENTVSVR